MSETLYTMWKREKNIKQCCENYNRLFSQTNNLLVITTTGWYNLLVITTTGWLAELAELADFGGWPIQEKSFFF